MDRNLLEKYRLELRTYAAELSEEMVRYIDLHWQRFTNLANRIDQIIKEYSIDVETLRLLDIGPSFQTMLINRLWPGARLDTFGFYDPKFPNPKNGFHIPFDLNKTSDKSSKINTEPYDIIIMAEVIEHLYTSPHYVFSFISSILKPGGYFIISTPNGVSLQKRLKMILGINPSELIREKLDDPGHFREYTPSELTEYAKPLGLTLHEQWTGYDATPLSVKQNILKKATPFLPSSLREHFTVVYKKKI